MRNLIYIFITVFIASAYLQARILDVPSAPFPTIQAGIDSTVDGDTVLVQPGTYFENLNFNGKNIVLASLQLTSEDTTYISQTVIDGGFFGTVVTFENGENSGAVLSGFKLANGFNFPGGGGGIVCKNNSSPTLQYLLITGNIAGVGGGLYCFNNANPTLSQVHIVRNDALGAGGGGVYCDKNSDPVLSQVNIINNTSNDEGGGMYLTDSCFAELSNVMITDNRSISNGGGIYCEDNSNLMLDSVQLVHNIAEDFGGGMFCSAASPVLKYVIIEYDTASHGAGLFFESSIGASLENVLIANNKSLTEGGGMSLYDSELSLKNASIRHNTANGSGGGMYIAFSNITFDAQDLSNIYLNRALVSGNDLFSEEGGDVINVIVDTFTVLNPSDYEASPIDQYTFNITNGKVLQAANDLYVSTAGNDSNSGLSMNEPLKTISFALTKILADSMNPRTVYLDSGLYSPATTGENYPLSMRDYVSIKAELDTGGLAVLDAQQMGNVMILSEDQGVSLHRLVLTGGQSEQGGAILSQSSNPVLSNVTITNNAASNGGAVYAANSYIVAVNTIMWNNSPEEIFFDGWADTSAIVLAYCDVQGGQVGIGTNNNGSAFWLEGNIEVDPQLNQDFTLSYPESPCLNAGTALFEWNQTTILSLDDQLGQFSGDDPEIGAYEYVEPPSGIASDKILPKEFALHQNFPNPFNPKTKITFSLAKPEQVEIVIFNTLGQKVLVLLKKEMKAGLHEITFDASAYASGLYFYSIEAGKFHQVKRMTLIK